MLRVLSIALFVWFFLATLIMFLWPFRPKVFLNQYKIFDLFDWGTGNALQRGMAKFIGFSAWLGLLMIIDFGLRRFLAFLPSSWGWTEESGWQSLRSVISILAGGIYASITIILLVLHNDKRRDPPLWD